MAVGGAGTSKRGQAGPGERKRRTCELGEALAAAHLTGAGYAILGRNMRLSGCEVDILARDGDAVVVVEVKTRLSAAFGDPIEQVGPAKLHRLVRAATTASAAWGGASARIDVIGVSARAITGGALLGVKLTHVVNVSC